MNRFDRRDPTFRADDEFRLENDPLLNDDLPHAAARARVEQLSNFLDNKFRLPVFGFRFGWDSIIGLIPGAGDIITALMSLYLMAEAAKAGAGAGMLMRMGLNVALDTILGAVPLLGDIFDFAFRSNYRNANLLRAYFEKLEKAREDT